MAEIEHDFIRIMSPLLPVAEKILPYLRRIDEAGIYSNFGPLEKEFSKKLSNYFQIPNEWVATCSNATLALQGALETSGASTDIIWELPAWTFTATAAALNSSGYSGKFVDVDIQGKMIPSSRAKAIIDVLPFGDSWDNSRLSESLEFVVVDAAASFDALANFPRDLDRHFGMILSFHATKILPAGEGAIFISNSPEWVEKFRNWTKFGMESGRISSFPGTNAKMSEYSAAVGLASFEDWPRVRLSWVKLIENALRISNQFGLRCCGTLEKGIVTPYWIVELNSEFEKIAFVDHLENLKIETRNWWESGCHTMPAYAHFERQDLSTTELIASRSVALPFHLRLTEMDWQRIESAFSSFFA